jgi:hypothetical protein
LLKKQIREYYLNEETGGLYIEFSTKEDGDDFYRSIELSSDKIRFYSPIIIDEIDDIDEELIVEILNGYFEDQDLPEETML